jgi:DnaJ-class molecular chaperone
MDRDLYEILGVPRTASGDDIRRAHRKLVRELHPDINKAPDATTKFAQAQEAYDILSDADKRARYDQFGMAGVKGGAAGAPGGAAGGHDPFAGGSPFGGGQQGWQNVDPETFEEIFGGMFGGGGQQAGGKGRKRAGGFGGFGGFGGGGSGFGGRAHQEAQPEQGNNLDVTETIDFTTAALGGTRSFRLQHNDQTVEVKIPAGVQDGAKLAVRGKGSPGQRGAAAGDLIITLRVTPHPWLRREGNDLLMDVPLSLSEAALGTTIKVPLLDGSVTLRVPAGIRSGQKLRVKAKGIHGKAGIGDFFAVLQIEAPKELSDEQRDALEKLALPNPRTGRAWD